MVNAPCSFLALRRVRWRHRRYESCSRSISRSSALQLRAAQVAEEEALEVFKAAERALVEPFDRVSRNNGTIHIISIANNANVGTIINSLL